MNEKNPILQIDMNKAKSLLKTLSAINSDIKGKSLFIVIRAKEDNRDLNVTSLHEELKKEGVVARYPNVTRCLKDLKFEGLIKTKKAKKEGYNITLIEPTKKAYGIFSFLKGVYDLGIVKTSSGDIKG